jgi:hypothetical protein
VTLTDAIRSGPALSADAGTWGEESARARLAWMGKLEASLVGSHKALLALDLAGIEQRTVEQIGLLEEFATIWRPRERSREPEHEHKHEHENDALDRAVRALELEKELRRRGKRILDAVRLQAALLARAQGKLRVLANMLAGPSADYGRLVLTNRRDQRAWDRKKLGSEMDEMAMRRRSDPCRA